MEEVREFVTVSKKYKYFVAVRFSKSAKAYFFGTDDETIQNEDQVVVDNAGGIEMATACSGVTPIENYKSELALKGILRKATSDDKLLYDHNLKRAEDALKITAEESEKLKLDMNLVSANYTLDGTKITITYISEGRVDFRELLKILAPRLKCRIELRQIGSRDKAKVVGGIGICGLPLCCSQFLNEFDGISINKAKNQLLALNIAKLSGHCGKLICCLNFEDEAYTEAKKEFPKIGSKFTKDGQEYKITSMNVLSKVIKVESAEDIQFLPLDEVKKLLKNEKRS